VADQTLHIGEPGELAPCVAFGNQQEACDDSWLVEGLRKGSETAYEVLITRFQQPVFNLISRLLNDQADACDITQEVFLKIFRKIDAFRGDSALKTWIYRIAVNEAYNYQRWFSRHRRQEIGLDADDGGNLGYQRTLSDPGRSPYECAEDRERHALVEAALANLSPSFRAAVVLRDIEELSYEEIADVLQVALGTVKSRIMRGREALRKELAGRLEPEPSLQWTPQTAE
jgi:RNA polymerase sigma-70 factor (ECF subfamily)